MNMTGLTTVSRHLWGGVARNSPTLLTFLMGAGVITTVALGIKATPKALYILEQDRDRREKESEYGAIDPLTKREVIKLVWRCYIPTAAMAVATIACGVGANSINLQRNAALASVYGIAEASLKEFEAKVVETIGEAKTQKIKDEIAKDHVAKNPMQNSNLIITNSGDMLCYDDYSGRYFRGDLDKIRRAEFAIKQQIFSESCASLNDAYYEMGLPMVPAGKDIGWNRDYLFQLTFSSILSPEMLPVLVIKFFIAPKSTYKELY